MFHPALEASRALMAIVRGEANRRAEMYGAQAVAVARKLCVDDHADPDAVVSTAVPMFHGTQLGWVWPDGQPDRRKRNMDFAQLIPGLYVCWEMYVDDAQRAIAAVESAR